MEPMLKRMQMPHLPHLQLHQPEILTARPILTHEDK
jgi:hypothetical protein